MRSPSILSICCSTFALIFQVCIPTHSFATTLVGSDTENYLRMIWGLLIVLGIILVIYGVLRKRFSLISRSPNQNIKVLEIKPLMGKRAICLVEVKGQEYVLGLGGDKVTHIATLPKSAEPSFADTLAKTEEDLGS